MSLFIKEYRETIDLDPALITDDIILEYFEENFKKRDVDRTTRDNQILKFENDMSSINPGWNHNIWVGIKSGEIKINRNKTEIEVTYLINTSRFINLGVIAGLLFGLFSQTAEIGLLQFIAFGFLGFATLGFFSRGISIIRHRSYFSKLLNEVVKNNKTDYNKS